MTKPKEDKIAMIKKKAISMFLAMFCFITIFGTQAFAATSIIPPAYVYGTDLPGYVNTQTDPLTVRSGPGTSYSKLGSLAKNTYIVIHGSDNKNYSTWSYITYPTVGWVKTEYVVVDFGGTN